MATGFQKAERKQAKLRLGITGPSGSSKTFTALEIATGMGGKIGLVDTEKKSASLYGDRFDFAVMELDEPYTADKFIKAIEAAGEAGIDDASTSAFIDELFLLFAISVSVFPPQP